MNSINIINKNYCMWDLDNIFVVFKKNKGGLYLVYPDLNSFTCYDLIDEEAVIKVKNAHEYYIINFRHTYDNNLNKDLIISVSGENNNAKLWDVEKWECMIDIKSNKYGIMFSACFLYDNNTRNNYIVTSNCTGSDYIKIFDFNGNKITDVPFNPKSKDNNNNNYINNGNNGNNNHNNDNNNDDKSNNDNDNDENEHNINNYEDNNNIDENNNNSNDISYNSNDYNIIEDENFNEIKNDYLNNDNDNKDINKEDEKNMKNDKKNYNNDKKNQINKENNITNNNEKINDKNNFSSNNNNNETLNKNNNIDNNVNNINVNSDNININQIINTNNNMNNIEMNTNHSKINDKDINMQIKQDIINDINNNIDNNNNEKIKDIKNNDECKINNDNQQIINDINIIDKDDKINMKQNYKFTENNKGNDNNIIDTEINQENNINNKKNDDILTKENNLNENHIDNDFNETNIIDNNIENDIIHNDIINNNDNHLNQSDNDLIGEEDNLSNDNNFNNNSDNNSHNNDNNNINNNINEFEYDNIYFVETYFDKINNYTYIIACCSQYVKSYNYNLNILYHKYQEHEMENRIHSSAIINESGNITKLIESSIDGYLRIWNFHECILLKRIKIDTGSIKGICLWDDNHILIGCDDKSIKVVDINNEYTIRVLFGHQKIACCIKTINHDKHGKCIVSKGWGDDVIKLWINNEIN